MHAVGIDIGTTNTKVTLVAIGPDGVSIDAVVSAPTPQPQGLKPLLLKLLRRILAGSRPPEAVGIASMAETGVPLDGSGRPLGSWLRWDGHRPEASLRVGGQGAGDAVGGEVTSGPRRAAGEASELSRRLGWPELVAATGVRPSGKVPLAVWAWLRAHQPDRWVAMARWAGVADLACLEITGRLATDHTLAGRTMAYRLPPADEPVPQGFDPDLLAEVGLRPDRLPEVVPPERIAGRVTDPAFVACGLRAGTPVVVAGHDHAVGAFASGVREPGGVADSVGTAEAVMSVVAAVPDAVRVGRGGMSTVVPVSGRHRAIVAGNSSSGATVAWWLEHESGGLAAEDLFARVRDTSGEPSEIIVLPYLSGRQAPEPDPSATLRVVGREPHHGPVELARAMLEGLCLQTRWMLEEQVSLCIGEAGGDPPTAVTVLGGASSAAHQAWLHLKARVMPWPLWLVTATEPVAAGAALLAAARAAVIGPEVPVLPRSPIPLRPNGYDEMLKRFVKESVSRR